MHFEGMNYTMCWMHCEESHGRGNKYSHPPVQFRKLKMQGQNIAFAESKAFPSPHPFPRSKMHAHTEISSQTILAVVRYMITVFCNSENDFTTKSESLYAVRPTRWPRLLQVTLFMISYCFRDKHLCLLFFARAKFAATLLNAKKERERERERERGQFYI